MWILKCGFLRNASPLLGACSAVLLFSLSAFSQANSGRILGSITDQTGGAITGATVSIRDIERGTTRTLTTDDAGAYSAPSLIPGTYVVKVEFQGFKTVERQNVVLEVGKEVRVDLALQPGEQSQTITVTEAIPLVDTTNATLGGTLQPGTISDLPLNGRNFMNLLQLRPGVTVYIGGGAWTQSTNGLRPEHNVYILDGITAMEPLGSQSTINSVSLAGDAATLLPIDTIQEFATQQNPKAEFGWKPGSITNVALKSGTNAFHGTANAFGRTDKLDATNNFLTGRKLPDGSPFKQQIALENFGATFGGPIKKDKTFFFLGYESQRYSVGNPGTFSFPFENTTAFADNTVAYNRANNVVAACKNALANVGAANLSLTSLKMAGLDATCARTSGYSVFDLDPSTYVRDSASPEQVFASLNTNYSVDNGLAKVDLHLGQKNTVNGKMFIGTHRGLVANSATIVQPYWRPTDQAWTLFIGAQWNYVANSSVVNTFRFGSNYFHQTFNTSDCTGQANGQPSYGLPFGFGGANNDTKPNCGFTNVTFQSFDASLGCCSSFPKFYGPDHINEFIDNVSVLHGNHAFKFGGEIRVSTLGDTGTFNRGRGQVSFRNTDGDQALENFMRGNTGTSSGNNGQIFIGEPRRALNTKAFAGFFQDDWRVKPRLMLNLGVRYEYVTPVTEKFGRLANFDPGLGLQQEGIQTTKLWNGDHNNFSPRLGLAWDVRGNGKTVLRAGGNLIYVNPGLWNQVFQQNTKDPTTGLNGNATGYTTCTDVVSNAAFCTPGIGNIVSSGIVLKRAKLIPNPLGPPMTCTGTGSTPQNCIPDVPGAGQVNWDQVQTVYSGNIYPGINDASSVFKCGLDKQCTIQATDQNLKTAYVTSWSLGFQQQINSSLSIQADYVGNHGTKLVGMQYTNTPALGAGYCRNPDGSSFTATQIAAVAALMVQIGGSACPGSLGTSTAVSAAAIELSRPLYGKFPYYSYIYTVSNPDMSNYNGAQITVTQRPTHGLSYTLGFTFAHALDMATSERGGPTNTPTNFRSDYSNSEFDIRKRFTATLTYALPGRDGFAQSLKGWKVTSIITAQSALPWGALGNASIDVAGQNEFVDRWNFSGNPADFSDLGKGSVPYWTSGSTIPSGTNPRTGQPYVAADLAINNPTCTGAAASMVTLQRFGCYVRGGSVMTPPAYGTYGNLVRDFFRGNTFTNWDASVIKDWKFTERFSGEFRLEIFNVLNHTNFGNPQFNGGGNTDPFSPSNPFGRSNNTPDVANNNPALGSGGPREFQLGFRLNF
jgi:Carboxypeptidase regulatory-like domain/TonB dependent receptor